MKAETMTRLTTKFACLMTALLTTISSSALAQNTNPEDRIAERDLVEIKRLLPGIYTNEEQVYFQENLDLPESEWVPRTELVVTRTGQSISTVTTFEGGRQIEARHDYTIKDGAIQVSAIRFGRADCSRIVTRTFDIFTAKGCEGDLIISPDGLRMTNGQGTFEMRRARTFKCWVSPRKVDGSYAYYNDLVVHDQGGRVWIEATDEHPRVGLKLRNVKWPTGVNRDSMVLYTYQGTDEDYSPSYVWADPDAERLAINTRWLQASCTTDDAT